MKVVTCDLPFYLLCLYQIDFRTLCDDIGLREGHGMAPQKDGKRVIQSIERAVSILDYLAEKPNGERLTPMSRELGLNKSTAFSLVASLEALDLISQDQDTGRYSLGVRMLQYGLSVQNHMDLVFDAQPCLDSLASLYGETVHMAVLSGNEIIYVAKAESTKTVRMVTQIGGKMPAYCSALGKVLLAALPQDQLVQLVETITFSPYTASTMRTPEALMEELERVRASGYACDREEREVGLFCVSAPVLDAHGECVAAISISLPAGRAAQHDIPKLIVSVQDTAADISCRLGGRHR